MLDKKSSWLCLKTLNFISSVQVFAFYANFNFSSFRYSTHCVFRHAGTQVKKNASMSNRHKIQPSGIAH
jgi:hypothetical protein